MTEEVKHIEQLMTVRECIDCREQVANAARPRKTAETLMETYGDVVLDWLMIDSPLDLPERGFETALPQAKRGRPDVANPIAPRVVAEWRDGASQYALAQKYGLGESTVHLWIRRAGA